MVKTFLRHLNYDWIAVTAVVFLLLTGLIAIYSLSLEAEKEVFSNFQKQLTYLSVAFIAFIFMSVMDYRIWKSYSGILYLTGVVLLVLVLLFGSNIRGTSGWFKLGLFNVQPVELMKFFLIISLAKYFSNINATQIALSNILVSFAYTLVPVFLATRQPDMGSAIVMLVIWFGMLFFAGLRKKFVFILIIASIIIAGFGWSFVLEDYQQQRIRTFLSPEKDPLGSGYNVIQSMVAVGSGGMGGKGIGHGSQSQLNFLPEKHTDFIFATIAEESGLVGVSLVLGLFLLLLFRMKKTAENSKDSFGMLIVSGVTIMIFFQAFVNIGMNIGMMPIAGLSLPFLSYGGSFLIVTLASFGLVQSVWKNKASKRVIFEES